MRDMRDTLAALARNPISQLGSVLALVSAVLFVTIMLIEILGAAAHPYVGIITYLLLPTVFVLGLVLIPLGIRRERRRSDEAIPFPIIDLNHEDTRKRLLVVLLLAAGITVILASATSEGLEYMSSNEFCGEICHSIMGPEYTAYQRSPHARVKCVDCHVGSGTEWLVRTKLNGAWMTVSTALNLYTRPIPTPAHNLRPTEGTCERCHWPEKFIGTRAKVITEFESNAANSEFETILLMNVGGHDFRASQGIHWHADPGSRIRYRSTLDRETIYEVELTLEDGTVKRYLDEEPSEDEVTEWRLMDCVDCHNRPTHVYYGADQAADLALERGFIKKDLPYIKREGVRAITGEYDSHAAAAEGVAASIADFYRTEYPELATERVADIEEAGRILATVYASNVFPSMNIGWDTYPDHIGHDRSPGCFRCHAGDHATADGEKISDDCEACHTIQ